MWDDHYFLAFLPLLDSGDGQESGEERGEDTQKVRLKFTPALWHVITCLPTEPKWRPQ